MSIQLNYFISQLNFCRHRAQSLSIGAIPFEAGMHVRKPEVVMRVCSAPHKAFNLNCRKGGAEIRWHNNGTNQFVCVFRSFVFTSLHKNLKMKKISPIEIVERIGEKGVICLTVSSSHPWFYYFAYDS